MLNHYSVPFKYPVIDNNDIGSFEKYLAANHKRVAVVVGAGPGGLLSATALQISGKFDVILVIEKRPCYVRDNAFNLRPQAFPMLRKLGLKEAYEGSAHFIPQIRFHSRRGEQIKVEEEAFLGDPEDVDYSLSPAKIFTGYGWPHHIIKINDFEKLLSSSLQKHSNIFLLHGEVDLINVHATENKMRSFEFQSANSSIFPNFKITEPNLVVVAAGAKSHMRDRLVGTVNLPDKPPEFWCTGVVSLNGIGNPASLKHLSVLENQNTKKFAFGFLNFDTNDIALNSTMQFPKNGSIDAKHIEVSVQESAYEILQLESRYLDLKLPDSPEQLKVIQSGKVAITYRRPNEFSFGHNLVFIGDAAGSGTPVGGYGLTFLASIYMDALLGLVHSSENIRGEALLQYGRRIGAAVDYWHSIDLS